METPPNHAMFSMMHSVKVTKKNSADDFISIYPNPSNGDFIVEWSNEQMVNELKIEVHNTLGQIIFSTAEKNPPVHFSKTIAAGHLSAGIYLLSIKTDHITVNTKLIINH